MPKIKVREIRVHEVLDGPLCEILGERCDYYMYDTDCDEHVCLLYDGGLLLDEDDLGYPIKAGFCRELEKE